MDAVFFVTLRLRYTGGQTVCATVLMSMASTANGFPNLSLGVPSTGASSFAAGAVPFSYQRVAAVQHQEEWGCGSFLELVLTQRQQISLAFIRLPHAQSPGAPAPGLCTGNPARLWGTKPGFPQHWG